MKFPFLWIPPKPKQAHYSCMQPNLERIACHNVRHRSHWLVPALNVLFFSAHNPKVNRVIETSSCIICPQKMYGFYSFCIYILNHILRTVSCRKRVNIAATQLLNLQKTRDKPGVSTRVTLQCFIVDKALRLRDSHYTQVPNTDLHHLDIDLHLLQTALDWLQRTNNSSTSIHPFISDIVRIEY